MHHNGGWFNNEIRLTNGGKQESGVSGQEKSCGKAASFTRYSLLATRNSQLAVYFRLLNPTRVGAPKTTGQIQNAQDFFEAGIAEVPPKNCSNSSFEFGARIWGGN
jgi:hypothetical protein